MGETQKREVRAIWRSAQACAREVAIPGHDEDTSESRTRQRPRKWWKRPMRLVVGWSSWLILIRDDAEVRTNKTKNWSNSKLWLATISANDRLPPWFCRCASLVVFLINEDASKGYTMVPGCEHLPYQVVASPSYSSTTLYSPGALQRVNRKSEDLVQYVEGFESTTTNSSSAITFMKI